MAENYQHTITKQTVRRANNSFICKYRQQSPLVSYTGKMSGEGGQYESSSLEFGSAPERFSDAAVPSSPAEVVFPLLETFLQLRD